MGYYKGDKIIVSRAWTSWSPFCQIFHYNFNPKLMVDRVRRKERWLASALTGTGTALGLACYQQSSWRIMKKSTGSIWLHSLSPWNLWNEFKIYLNSAQINRYCTQSELISAIINRYWAKNGFRWEKWFGLIWDFENSNRAARIWAKSGFRGKWLI